MHWWDVARSQAAAVSVEQLVLAGETRATVGRLAARGELARFCQGVYIAGAAPLTFRTRLWASVLATDGIVSHATAGRVWGIHEADEDQIHLTIPHTRRVARPPGATLHRVPVPTWGRCVRSDLPMTTRSWTVLDLMACQPSADAMRLADRAMQRGWIRRSQLEQRLRDQPCRTGNRQLRVLLSQLCDGAAANSERVLHALLRRADLRGWRANHEVWVDGELVAVVDVAVPSLRIAIEVDGMAFHTDVDRFQRDRTRQNALVALGWTVIRFTWADLVERPGYVVATVHRFGSVLPHGAA